MPTKTPVNRCVHPKEREVGRYATYVHSNIDGGGIVDQNSICIQREAIRECIATEKAVGPVTDYEDIGQPDAPDRRPALTRLKSDAAGGRVDKVIICRSECMASLPSEVREICVYFQQLGVPAMHTGPLPTRIVRIAHAALSLPEEDYADELRKLQQAKKATAIRCGLYTRGDRRADEMRNLDTQLRGIMCLYMHLYTLKGDCLPRTYEDFQLPDEAPRHSALHRLLADVDAGQLDCVLVHTFDLLTAGGLSPAEILRKFRQRDVTLVTIHPVLFHVWGQRMEDAWITSLAQAWRKRYRPQPADRLAT